MHPAGSFPAGRALTAGFVGEELGRRPQGLDHGSRLIHHDHAGGTGHGTRSHQGIEVHADVDLVRREHLRGDSTWNDRLEFATAQYAPRMLVDQLP